MDIAVGPFGEVKALDRGLSLADWDVEFEDWLFPELGWILPFASLWMVDGGGGAAASGSRRTSIPDSSAYVSGLIKYPSVDDDEPSLPDDALPLFEGGIRIMDAGVAGEPAIIDR